MAEELARAEDEHLRRYLVEAKESAGEGITVEMELRTGPVVEEVLNVINERQAEYLVLSTHGRSGLSRWRYGSIAGRLIREAAIPTLVVGPGVPEVQQAGVRRILVPLDGTARSEAALPAADALAKQSGADVIAARVVQWASQLYPSFDPVALNDALGESAQAYLDKIRASHSPVSDCAVLRGLPADELIQYVERRNIDLVVMTSHSRTGVERTVLGSVADRMLQCAAPVMIVRPAS
jgi:nucleotide-binding universal stress UspA family protein